MIFQMLKSNPRESQKGTAMTNDKTDEAFPITTWDWYVGCAVIGLCMSESEYLNNNDTGDFMDMVYQVAESAIRVRDIRMAESSDEV